MEADPRRREERPGGGAQILTETIHEKDTTPDPDLLAFDGAVSNLALRRGPDARIFIGAAVSALLREARRLGGEDRKTLRTLARNLESMNRASVEREVAGGRR